MIGGLLRSWRRRRLARRPLPEEWLPLLERRVPFFARLAGAERERFLELLKIFVWEKEFVGAQGQEITDEVRVAIAACAVRLVLRRGRGLADYDRLTEIVVYPYVYQHQASDGAVLGEAHDWGVVVLAWPAVLAGLQNDRDGHETAAHEFAHVLDRVDGAFDGTPELGRLAAYGPWARVMSERYLGLRARRRDERRVLRDYGATNEAEFFAVATEAYFEKPRQMQAETPDLYAELQRFYGGDPAAELGGPDATPAPAATDAARQPGGRRRKGKKRRSR